MSDPPLTLLRALVDFGSFERVLFERHAPVHGPRHATAPSGASSGGRIRSKSRLPGRSLLPSSTLERVPAPRSSRTFDRSARQFLRSDCATLLTLAPTFPTRSGPCDPAAQPGFLSWGCPKISPPSCSIEESASRGRFVASPRRPCSFEMRKPIPIRVPPSWFLTTSTVCSSPTVRPFAGRCRSWGSLRFLLSRNRISRGAPAALRSLPSADSYGRRDESRPSVGPRHRSDRLRSSRSPRTFPPRPSTAVLPATWTSRSCSIVGSVARPDVSVRTCPVLPWA